MHRLWRAAETEARRLLRVLFVWLGALSTDAARTFRRARCSYLLCVIDQPDGLSLSPATCLNPAVETLVISRLVACGLEVLAVRRRLNSRCIRHLDFTQKST